MDDNIDFMAAFMCMCENHSFQKSESLILHEDYHTDGQRVYCTLQFWISKVCLYIHFTDNHVPCSNCHNHACGTQTFKNLMLLAECPSNEYHIFSSLWVKSISFPNSNHTQIMYNSPGVYFLTSVDFA